MNIVQQNKSVEVGEDICHICIKEFVYEYINSCNKSMEKRLVNHFYYSVDETNWTSQKKIPKWLSSIENINIVSSIEKPNIISNEGRCKLKPTSTILEFRLKLEKLTNQELARMWDRLLNPPGGRVNCYGHHVKLSGNIYHTYTSK